MTTPNLYDEKEVMEEFISCYRHFSALWDNGSMDYLSKKKKEPGYQELLKILRRVNRGASVQDVKRKINSLRCCYRREIKKIRMSYNTYEPRLWWFHMMDFLKPVLNLNEVATSSPVKRESQSLYDSLDEASMQDEDIFAEPFQPEEDMLVLEGVGEGEGDADVDADVEVEEEEEGGMDAETELKGVLKMENKYQTHSNSNNNNNNNNSNNNNNKHAYSRLHSHSHSHPYGTNQTSQSQLQSRRSGSGVGVAPVSATQSLRRRRRSSYADDYEEESSAVAATPTATAKKRRQMIDQMVSRSVEHADSECDLIGKRMAAHFRNMRPDQRLYAERIISEVLVYGRMNRLSLDARFLPNGGATSSTTPTPHTTSNSNTDEVLYGRDDVK
ncbi:tRNA-specific adenosine deaminase 1 isoform X2 [Drosophila innubila]|uniref:tRNA-specific adenosine deaminase 1 isoform X2 n=1 Tax=Drosophila innubila TaxID=198719 RepID=UPI00148C2561|nr:tRNA-specific adenosine deaminase 1 isoform X2 [Drosophila innubila]